MPVFYSSVLAKRDDYDHESHFGGWLYSEEGRTIRYGILLGIIFLFIVFLTISYKHAHCRMNQGLPPLAYHRWLVSRKRRAEFERASSEPEQNFSFYQHEHGLHPVPPPAYNPQYVQPPSYPGPPEDASKSNPQQYYPPPYPESSGISSAPVAGPSTSTEQRP
ncbi:hypothetical protein BDZ91DRAFT_57998 [Kalaharituber pfeilii]|nr:hypothetical protein BDZ91DRAFT_57998 [Kalaharituber pfeilii]